MVSWQTNPGPEDLAGYRLERLREGEDWSTVTDFTRDTRYHDSGGRPSDRYRLFAINGLGDEIYVGETSSAPSLSNGLSAWPVPFHEGTLNISFPTGSLGGNPVTTDVSIYDAAGRLVRHVTRGRFAGATRITQWNGRDEGGELVPSGVYFVRLQNGLTEQTRKIVIVR